MAVWPLPSPEVPLPPWEPLRARLLALAEELETAGDDRSAQSLRALVESWWHDQRTWNAAVVSLLRVSHEINNALVGVSGNVQLLMMSQAGKPAGIRERLEVVLRESRRIEDAARRLHELKGVFEPDHAPSSERTDVRRAADAA